MLWGCLKYSQPIRFKYSLINNISWSDWFFELGIHHRKEQAELIHLDQAGLAHQEMLSANRISVFFNHQYLLNGLTCDFDFFIYIDRHESKEQIDPISLEQTCLGMPENVLGK